MPTTIFKPRLFSRVFGHILRFFKDKEGRYADCNFQSSLNFACFRPTFVFFKRYGVRKGHMPTANLKNAIWAIFYYPRPPLALG